jgi:tellurite resistance protein TerC
VLVFVGAKMALTDVVQIPVFASLGVVLLALAAAIIATLVVDRRSGNPADEAVGADAAPANHLRGRTEQRAIR